MYTQVSDAEDKTNGLLTCDRRVTRLFSKAFADIGALLAQRMQAVSSAT